MPCLRCAKAFYSEALTLREVYLENPPLLYPPPPRGRKWADNPLVLLPWREEAGRRGLYQFADGPLGHEEL
jgi:hypothetical protein